MFANKQKQKERLDVCLSCPNRTSLLGLSKCQLCGCAIRGKILLESEQCPAKKW